MLHIGFYLLTVAVPVHQQQILLVAFGVTLVLRVFRDNIS